jgi:hypothetical protein
VDNHDNAFSNNSFQTACSKLLDIPVMPMPILMLPCRRTQLTSLTEVIGWDKVVDFPHGSFRLLGSRKPARMSVCEEACCHVCGQPSPPQL